VWLDLPLDVQGAQVDPDAMPGYTAPAPAPRADLEKQVAETVRILESGERPVILLGNGVRLAGAAAEVPAILESIGAPVLLTWLGLDLLADDHPLFAGRPGVVAPRGANFTAQTCDRMVAIGARIDNVLTGYAPARFAGRARRVVVDVDPAELAKHPDSVELRVCADAGDFLRELRRQWGARPPLACEPWRRRVQEWRARYPIVPPESSRNSDRISIYALADAFSDVLSEGDVVVNGSSGSGIEVFLHAFRIRKGQRFLHSTALGAMGFAVPMGIGACLAAGRRTTTVIDGDGGFQFNIQEMETIRRLALPLKFFILDNDGYASIRASQRNYFGRLVGADASSGLTLPELEGVAAAWKIPFRRIAVPADLKATIRAVLSAPGPEICAVEVIPDEDREPRIYSRVEADGSMSSSPLEDLYPPLSPEELAENVLVPEGKSERT
jgi:acetolactate synthase-1/2/3 large subunit